MLVVFTTIRKRPRWEPDNLLLLKRDVWSMPVHHCILEACNLLSGFSVSQLERNFASGLTTPQVSSTPDLDDM